MLSVVFGQLVDIVDGLVEQRDNYDEQVKDDYQDYFHSA